MDALVSLMAVYNWDNNIFDNFTLPSGMDHEVLQELLLKECAELNLVYSDPTMVKTQIGIFSRAKLNVWTRLWTLANAEYNPIDNYKRTIIETTVHGTTEQVDYADHNN